MICFVGFLDLLYDPLYGVLDILYGVLHILFGDLDLLYGGWGYTR